MFIVALIVPTAISATPKDDLAGHSLEKEMRAVIEKGIMAGYGPNRYGPDDPITRAQFATFLARALKLPAGEANFADVSSTYGLRDGIARAASAGLVSGYPNNIFKPDQKITREQMAALIDRSLDYLGIAKQSTNLSFTDNEQIAPMFRNAVANNTYFGIINGYPVGNGKYRFGPKESATRAQAAAFINRLLTVAETGGKIESENKPSTGSDDKPAPTPSPSDNEQGKYKVGTISNGSFISDAKSYESINEAKKRITDPSKQVVLLGNDVVWMKSGIAYAKPTNGQAVINIYSDQSLSRALTYVSSGVELGFIEVQDNKVKVQIADKIGYVKSNEVKLVPSLLIKGRSHYKNEGGHLVHYVYDSNTNSYGSYTFGKAPSFMSSGVKYYSWDGIKFYQANGSLAGEAHQYFNYLPLRSKTSYTAEQLDSYIKYVAKSNSNLKNSPLDGLGKTFKEAEEKYNINALYLFAKAIHESYYGLSEIAQEKKNLFGYQAYDKDPLGNAKPFKSYEESIMFVAESMNNRYLTPPASNYNHPETGAPGSNLCANDGKTTACGENYRGAVLGNKGHGMNMRYASDPFWGQKIAGHMYRIDNFLGNKDIGKIEIGQTTGMLNVRPAPNTSQAAQYTFPSAGYYVALLETSKQQDGTWYKIYSDHKYHPFGYVHGDYIKKITPVK